MARKEILLAKNGEPGTKTRIYQSNRVTNAHYNYSLIQERIFNYTMFVLQGHIEKIMAGTAITQLDLFQVPGSEISIPIPLSAIATPAQYGEVKQAAEGMVSCVMKIPGRDETGKTFTDFTGLYSSIRIPDKRSSVIHVQLRQDVARYLIAIDRNNANKPCNYTGFLIEVALQARNKYTPRMYKLISSWKEKGGLYITLDELKEQLGCNNMYSDYNSFKRSVLVPAQEELKTNADCWYNVAEIDEIKTGKKVTALRFKIVTVPQSELRAILLHNLYNVLRVLFGCKEEHIALISPTLEHVHNIKSVEEKLNDLHHRLQHNTDISDIPAYVIKSLRNEFSK